MISSRVFDIKFRQLHPEIKQEEEKDQAGKSTLEECLENVKGASYVTFTNIIMFVCK